ncbi:MAG: hypothetical protein JEZ03_09540 [Bacteroidales bacterium]|nr:hypothetical protein [Bacteroidales bacterium]
MLMIYRRISLLVCMIMMINVNPLFSQEEDQTFITKKLFTTDDVLNIRIEADFKTVFSLDDDSTYFPARITLVNENNELVNIDIQIRTRGNYRRKRSTCTFSPLQIKFPKKKTKNTVFEGQRAIKLVTHCQKRGSFEQNTVNEYLIYKTLNILTDSSLKVRPAIINYVYNGKRIDSIERFAFFIERPKHLAERMSGRLINAKYVHPDSTDFDHMTLVDLFQFMIGNTDYSVYNMHNVKLISVDPFSAPVVIPYDFDWCGQISAPYAIPNPIFNTTDVRQRIFRGFTRTEDELKPVIDKFNSKKELIQQLYEFFPLLNKKELKRVIDYNNEFYEIINSEKLLNREIIQAGRINH